MKVYQLVKTMMNGQERLPIAYTDKDAAAMRCTELSGEWTDYTVQEVEARSPRPCELVCGTQLVEVRVTTRDEMLRAQALARLTPGERVALGFPAVQEGLGERLFSPEPGT